jgi:hypothetical protein
MVGRKINPPSPASLARAERQRLAKEEGAEAMVEVERHAADVRQNMQRLKALREARERETPPPAKTKKAKAKRAPKTSQAARG